MKNVILFATHILNDYVVNQIKKLYNDTKGIADMYVLLQVDHLSTYAIPPEYAVFPFTIENLNSLGYEPWAETIIPGSNHFAVLYFYENHPEYEYYWNIEYDVTFSGNWQLFFKFYNDKNDDFITSHIASIEDMPNWEHWNDIELNEEDDIPAIHYLKSFNPIYRISNNALHFISTFLKKGNRGHHELLLPTILNYHGYYLRDLGENDKYACENTTFFYTKPIEGRTWYDGSTMRYRPVYYVDEVILANKLYHPIKETCGDNIWGFDLEKHFEDIIVSTHWLYNKNINLSNYIIDKAYIYSLINILNKHCFERILDLGGCQKTDVFNQYTKYYNCRLYTVDSDTHWIKMLKYNYPDAAVLNSFHYYKSFVDEASHYIGLNHDLMVKNDRFDLISVDGPLGDNCRLISRINIIDIISSGLLADKFVIMFHDTNIPQYANTAMISKRLIEKNGVNLKVKVLHYGKGTTILTNIEEILV